MKGFWALLRARNIEFYRDRGSMTWAFVFPTLVIVGCALAFSRPDTSVFTVGVLADEAANLDFLGQPYIATVTYDNAARARERIAHHQLDLLIDAAELRYWINPESTTSLAAEELFLGYTGERFTRETLSGRAIRYVDWVLPGVLGMNIMFGALFGVGFVIVRYRQNGVLKRLQATPVTPLQFIAAQLGSRLFVVVAVNTAIFIGCHALLDLLVLGSYLDLFLIAVAGGMSMVSLGLVFAARTSNEELASGMLNAASWPMLFLSDVWFSLDRAPHWLQWAADLLPLTHIVKAARAVMIEGAGLADIGGHLLALVAMSALFTVLAALMFRWHADQ